MPENEADKSLQPDGADAQLALVGALSAENTELTERLRRTQIPHHVGMAAAGRALSIDLPRVLVAQVQTELTSGALGQRWDAAIKRIAGQQENPGEAALAALAGLLLDQAQKAGRYLAARAEEWASDAYRLEGQANALEGQVQRLERARDGITKSRQQGAAMELRQEERRTERDSGQLPPSEDAR